MGVKPAFFRKPVFSLKIVLMLGAIDNPTPS
jgi:hypothetical protein